MEKKYVVFIVLILFILPYALLAQVTVITPTVVPTGDPALDDFMNDALATVTNELTAEINTQIQPYIGQEDLALGFANAGATSTHTGTQRNYNDYKIFALTLGSGFAFSAPSTNSVVIAEAINNIETEGDIYFGAAAQPITATLGINMDHFVENLYGAVKFGYADISAGTISDDFSFKTLSLGAFLNYQFLDGRKLPLGILRWRGLSLGSGVLYQRNKSGFKINFPVDPVSTGDISDGSNTYNAEISINPTLTMGVTSNSWTIPLEATTGVRLLWLLDLNIGAGVDVAFGNSEVKVNLDSPVVASESSDLLEFNDGSANIDLGTNSDGPQFIRPRLTAGLGLNIGPVKLDIPLMYYFDSEGNSFMMGVNAGIVW
ncbi:hypothetical protein EXM22_13550 [Oceanispirochaeta crateris]|uniref:Autotransporter outer membrane beta-barrel domain-containing protein n=1 Tax=Oceanispirochaeta crateris TaxID=2518645 RepID=A0A5C1QNQ1_9SPIO|nr:hypothetical protein [Oceanispirochaeta crateris]QEN08968.1 hypothetical protein EXM22_13550 [Oceanispirochaeta crateris]